MQPKDKDAGQRFGHVRVSIVTERVPEPFVVEIGAARWSVQTHLAVDLSIPLQFDALQPQFFGAPAASGRPIVSGAFIGDVLRGGSCNCSTYSMTPHCNGTHTECIGHITHERVSIRDVAMEPLLPAVLVTVTPEGIDIAEDSHTVLHADDRVLTRAVMDRALSGFELAGCKALVVRTLPNMPDKLHRNYDIGHPPPYFSSAAMQLIVSYDFQHLIVDLPSVDRCADQGRLVAHRVFWGMPAGESRAGAARRTRCTITELAYIGNSVPDGHYLLNLQIAPFAADAAPSRPLLYPLLPA